MTSLKIKIIGGGIAGLASALAVARAGHSALVLEKASRFEPLGAGLQLGPNAARALQQLGAWDAMEPTTFAPPEIHIRDGKSGKILHRLTLGQNFERRFGLPYRVAHRADLHRALLQVAQAQPGIELKTGVEDTDLSDGGFAGIIAADGIWSKTRERLFPNSAAIMTKHLIHRALIPLPSNSNGIAFDCVNLWLYPGGHVVHYPVGNPLKLNLVVVTNGQLPLIHFKNATNGLQEILALPSAWTNWPAAYVPPLKQWNQNNITLIGDAAHGTLPYLAQGAAMALEDAVVLGKLLNLSPSTAFLKLAEDQIKRTFRLHQETLFSGYIYHLPSPLAPARNLILQALSPLKTQERLSWIYDNQR